MTRVFSGGRASEWEQAGINPGRGEDFQLELRHARDAMNAKQKSIGDVAKCHWQISGPDLFGSGFSAGSNTFVLEETGKLHLSHPELPLDVELVAKRALARERNETNGLQVATDDVYPIVYGGVMELFTSITSGVRVNPVSYSAKWIEECVVVGLNPHGERHDIPTLLADLFQHPDSKSFVAQISLCARHAARAMQERNLAELGEAVRGYSILFDQWTRGRYFNQDVQAIQRQLEQACGDKVLAVKPPGGGAASAIIVISTDAATVVEFLRNQEWLASPARVTGGLQREFNHDPRKICWTAGHRIDFVGAADLGIDPTIAQDGICTSCAIEPRSKLTISRCSSSPPRP